jgi:hypothetical protein
MICGIFVVGMFEYILLMPKDANRFFSLYGIFCRYVMSWMEFFFMLNVSGKWIIVLNISETNFASLYAGAFRQVTIGCMRVSGLWILGSPFRLGGAWI